MAGNTESLSKKKGKKKNEGGSDVTSLVYIQEKPKEIHFKETLTEKNYADWCQEMMNLLKANKMVGFVNGSFKKPEEDSTDFKDWMHSDTMIKGWLKEAMVEEIRTSVEHDDTASEIWTNLKERFGNKSAYELKKILSTTCQNGDTVLEYYTKLDGLWKKIESVLPLPECSCKRCTCDVGKKFSELKEKEKLYEFLMGLDSSFSKIRAKILTTNTIQDVGNAKNLVEEDEQLQAISASKKPATEAKFKTNCLRPPMPKGGC